jgi:hypothetical protein
MATSAKLMLGRLLLLMAFAGSASAQTAPGDGDGKPQPPQTDGTLLQEPVAQPAPARAVKTKMPTTAGRWVPRVDAKTCPKGSTAFVDDKNGGVKCWVNDK